MHLGSHGARHPASRFVLRPEFVAADAVDEEFDDRKAVPDHAIAVPEDRHLAHRRRELVALAALLPLLVEHGNDEFLEFLARLPAREPAAHRPARIGTIADDQLEQIFAPRWLPLPVSQCVTRRCRYRFRSTS